VAIGKGAIRIEIQDQKVKRLLARLVEMGSNPMPAMEEIGGMMTSSTRDRFKESKAPDGSAWQALTPATLIARARLNKRAGFSAHAQPLLSTGVLRNSIGFRVGPREVVVGVPMSFASVNLHWSHIHHFGGQAGRGRKVTIPARPFLGLSSEDRAAITAILRARISGAA